MEETLNFIEECSQSFHCYYNLGDKAMVGNKHSLSKQAVEKFIFNKIYPILYELYSKKYQKENELFLMKQSKIKSDLSYENIMNYLEVSCFLKNFRLRRSLGLSLIRILFISLISQL